MALIRTGTHYGSPLGSSLKNDLSGLRHLLSWDPFTGTESRSTSFVPRMNVVEREHGYTISADLPGVAEDDVEVTMHEGRLTIAGRQESEDRKEDETYVLYERSNGSFQRTFVLPDKRRSGVYRSLSGLRCSHRQHRQAARSQAAANRSRKKKQLDSCPPPALPSFLRPRPPAAPREPSRRWESPAAAVLARAAGGGRWLGDMICASNESADLRRLGPAALGDLYDDEDARGRRPTARN